MARTTEDRHETNSTEVDSEPREPESMHSVGSTRITAEGRLVYSVGEAAALLGISRAFAYELVARGELPVIRLGRRRLVPRIGLLALIGSQVHAGESPSNASL